MSKVINLRYFIAPNFGDALSPWLLKELTNYEIRDKNLILKNVKETVLFIIRCIINREYYKLKEIAMPWDKVVLAVGSMLKYSSHNCHVWGSGFMNYGETCSGGRIYAVRGNLSATKLKELGIITSDVLLGDPALLLPLIIPSRSSKYHKIGLIPHYKETETFIKKFKGEKIIDLRTKNILKVIDEISQCEYILSSSLHGLIVAHSYGIPALWICDKKPMDTDGFKFKDYFSSVGIRSYIPIDVNNISMRNDDIETLFFNKKKQALIQFSLKEIQKELLSVAPFKLNEKYSRICVE